MTVFSNDKPTPPSDPHAPVALVSPEVDVALVDDDPVIAALVKQVVGKHGFSATWYDDGTVAVAALCQARTPIRARVILLDVSMPGLDGFGVLHYLRRSGALNVSKVIMLTASASEQDVRHAIGLGATGYLAKPLDTRLLVDRIRNLLRRGPSFPNIGSLIAS